MSEKICFVVMGYGEKTDLNTGRKLNLDKTFEHLIKPVFDDLDITCIRASDIKHSGVIDVPMYEYILKADIVIADISTLNANAIYELGIRHGVRPFSTIVIAEDKLDYPFDLNHVKITPYQHLGVDIGATEMGRFQKSLKNLVENVLQKMEVDSPVYTYIKGLNPPKFTDEEKELLKEVAEEGDRISELIKAAEDLKVNGKYVEARKIFSELAEKAPMEPFIIQRLALVTYKAKQPSTLSSLVEAEKILEPLNPDFTNDIETLGLLGAINKRLHEETSDKIFLERAIRYYERGFITGKDYYNGVNLAYLYLLNASLTDEDKIRTADLVNASRIRQRTLEICQKLKDTKNFEDMPDRIWILLTLAEITAIDESEEAAEVILKEAEQLGIEAEHLQSYEEQKMKTQKILEKLNK